MNCESAMLVMNAVVDEELSDADRRLFEQHLADCPSCRETWLESQNVDRLLRESIQPPSADAAIERLLQSISAESNQLLGDSHVLIARPNGSKRVVRRVSSLFAVVAAGTLIVFVSLQLRPNAPRVEQHAIDLQVPTNSTIAEITYLTGTVEIVYMDTHVGAVTSEPLQRPLIPKTLVRTSENALCEIRTKSDAVVRLNHGTELLFVDSERLELMSGELWCRAPSDAPLKISSESAQSAPLEGLQWTNMFTCPSSSETQWESKPDHDFRCLAASSQPVDITVSDADFRLSMKPGEVLSFQSVADPKIVEHVDLLKATSWQLPLLILRDPNDQELQHRLTQILARIGQTKMSHLYEDQIRQLGPAGTIPLLAYVISPGSKNRTDLRQRAMWIIADLAPPSATPDLRKLLNDEDPVIRRLSSAALHRLNPED